MRARIIGAAVLVGAALAVVASTALGAATQAASSITVWLQVGRAVGAGRADRRRRPTPRSRRSTPAWTVNVQYQTWGNHLQKFDATLAGGNAPDVIEMGNTEMTKYMAAGAFQDLTVRQGVDSRTRARGSRASRRPAATAASSTASRTTRARASSPTAPTCSRRPGSRCRRASPQFTAAAKKLGTQKYGKKGFSPVYIAGTDWYVAMGFVYDFGGKIATQVSGKWKGTLDSPQVDRRPDRVQELLQRRVAGRSKTTDETHPNPYSRVRTGPRGSMLGPAWFSCCVGDEYKNATAQFVMPSHTKGQPMPGFLGGSDLAVPIGAEQGARRRLDQGATRARRR